MKIWEWLQMALQSPTFSSVLGLTGIGLAFFFGFYQNKLNHFNRTRYIKSIEKKVSIVSRADTLKRYNLHTVTSVYEVFAMLLLSVVGSTGVIISYIVLFSGRDNSAVIMVINVFIMLSAAWCFYSVATRLKSSYLMLQALLTPWSVLSDLEADLQKNSTAALLSDSDKQGLLELINAEKRDWLMDEKT